MSEGWRLGIVLGLLAATAGVVYVAPPVLDRGNPIVLYGLPTTLAGWTATDGVPEPLLPPDPHEMATVRRAYRNGQRIAWISVAMFTRQDDPVRRASIDRIYPQQHVALVERARLTVVLDGSVPTALPAVVIHRAGQQLMVVYWHEIGRRAYGSEYWFRWALMRNILFARRGDSVLVRIAVPVSQTEGVSRSLAAVTELVPSLYAALADALSQ